MQKKQDVTYSITKKDDLVVVQLRGALGFDEPDFQSMRMLRDSLRDELAAEADRFLVDIWKFRIAYWSSVFLFITAFRQPLESDSVKLAFWGTGVLTSYPDQRYIQYLQSEGIIDVFDSEGEAIAFLGAKDRPRAVDTKGFKDILG